MFFNECRIVFSQIIIIITTTTTTHLMYNISNFF